MRTLMTALEESDARRRRARADRIEWRSTAFGSLPAWIARIEIPALYNEAIHCFIDGHFIAAAITATALVEQQLLDTMIELGLTTNTRMMGMDAVALAGWEGLLRPGLVVRATAMISRRNGYAHLKSPDDCCAFAKRYTHARVHPDRLREIDAKKALAVMHAVLVQTMR